MVAFAHRGKPGARRRRPRSMPADDSRHHRGCRAVSTAARHAQDTMTPPGPSTQSHVPVREQVTCTWKGAHHWLNGRPRHEDQDPAR